MCRCCRRSLRACRSWTRSVLDSTRRARRAGTLGRCWTPTRPRRRTALSADGDAFDTLIARLDPAMAIVTAVSDNERGGCLIGFYAQCSIDPPRYVVWLSKANHTFRVGLHARHFAVHFLPDDIDDE